MGGGCARAVSGPVDALLELAGPARADCASEDGPLAEEARRQAIGGQATPTGRGRPWGRWLGPACWGAAVNLWGEPQANHRIRLRLLLQEDVSLTFFVQDLDALELTGNAQASAHRPLAGRSIECTQFFRKARMGLADECLDLPLHDAPIIAHHAGTVAHE